MIEHVFRNDAGWHFWDESGIYFYGPYDTEDEAHAARVDYLARMPRP